MAFPVFFDTCAIYGAGLADLLLTLAEKETYRPLWSADVFEELRRNLVDAGIEPEAVDRRLRFMASAFPDAMVEGYEDLIPKMGCDEKDRHVLAAAIRGGASIVVTFNIKHFPTAALEPYGIQAVHPDDFLLDQLDLYPVAVLDAVDEVPGAYENPPVTIREFLNLLARSSVPRFASTVAPLL
ncbi:MAG: PIN domain-containing protein [Propionibacteriaceae bacterium]|jgi:predicted nucleic acid-binding protein|nr:PIN domain-containing protein [Propionibacteriaceae bacterium]